MMKITSLGLF